MIIHEHEIVHEYDMILEDKEEDWVLEEGFKSSDIIFHHKYYPSLYRRINLRKEEVTFTDTARISMDNIIDVEKKLNIFDKARIMKKVVAAINTVRPISMPYTPETLKVYVLYEDPYLGVMAYKTGKGVVKVNKFYDWLGEIDRSVFFKNIGEEKENVDPNTEQTKDH